VVAGQEVSGLDPQQTYQRAKDFYDSHGMFMSAMTPFENYGLTNGEFRPVPLGEQYDALDTGEVDVVDAFTTDPQLQGDEYVLLQDPELLFGSQNVTMVVSKDKLERINSEHFLSAVDAVNAKLTTTAIVDLNAEVTAGREDSEVARDFLRSVNLSTPLRQ
jgi:glycine betaine/choline ABC-type transport system substrate-binding protein